MTNEEVEFQLNVCGSYQSETTALRDIQKAVQKAINEIASCEFVEVTDAHPNLNDYDGV